MVDENLDMTNSHIRKKKIKEKIYVYTDKTSTGQTHLTRLKRTKPKHGQNFDIDLDCLKPRHKMTRTKLKTFQLQEPR